MCGADVQLNQECTNHATPSHKQKPFYTHGTFDIFGLARDCEGTMMVR